MNIKLQIKPIKKILFDTENDKVAVETKYATPSDECEYTQNFIPIGLKLQPFPGQNISDNLWHHIKVRMEEPNW